MIDPTHSNLSFSVRHLMISKVRGSFGKFAGEAKTDGLNCVHLTGIVDTTSISTNDETRDGHLKSADFFDVENYPTMTLTAKEFTVSADSTFTVEADLTIKDVTRPVTLRGEFGGIVQDPYGKTKAAMELTGKINRTDWGLNWNSPLETGGVLIGEEITIHADIQAVLVDTEEGAVLS